MDDPLDSSGNLVYAPGEIPEGLTFQSNRLSGGDRGADPVGDDALEVTAVFQEYGPPQKQLRTPVAGSSLDVLVDGDRYSALRVATFQTATVNVFDTAGNLLDSRRLSGREIIGHAGVIAEPGVEIGRVNVTEPSDSDEVVVNTYAYGDGQPEPAPEPEPEPDPGSGEGNDGGLGGLLGRIGEIVGISHNKRKGTATVAVKMSGPARVSLGRTKRVTGTSKRARQAGTVRLEVRLRDGARRKLARAARKGRASIAVRIKVTCRSAGGERYTTTKRIRVIRKR